MSLLQDLLGGWPCPPENRQEVDKLYRQLIQIGKRDGFLAERPGGIFNMQSRNTEARQIGQRLYSIGGVPLLDRVMRKIRRPLGKELSAHLEYCWAETGDWLK
jgi:hypothetical protein